MFYEGCSVSALNFAENCALNKSLVNPYLLSFCISSASYKTLRGHCWSEN